MKQQDIWAKWLDDNWIYIHLGLGQDEDTRNKILQINKSCEKRGISFKSFMEILTEVYND